MGLLNMPSMFDSNLGSQHPTDIMDPYEVDDEPRMVSRNPMLIPCFLAVDYICMAGVVVLWFVLLFTENLPGPTHRGFWCHDRNLMMPYLEDDIFTEEVLYVTCFAAPPIMVSFIPLTTEFCHSRWLSTGTTLYP